MEGWLLKKHLSLYHNKKKTHQKWYLFLTFLTSRALSKSHTKQDNYGYLRIYLNIEYMYVLFVCLF